MSGAAVISAIAAVVGAGAAVYQGEKQRSAALDAKHDARDAAQKQEAQTAAQLYQQNRRRANSESALAKAGQGLDSGTMLTGPNGVDPSTLPLGGNTLLGG